MTPESGSPGKPITPDVAALLERASARPGAPAGGTPARAIVVDVERQKLLLLTDHSVAAEYAVSTAANGIGGQEGSNRTPPGWHRIHSKIGAGAENGTVFESREPTGRVWHGESEPSDLILTRILRLDGLEPGVNRGPGYDSLERYIYIHGTNHEGDLGRPGSHGCIRMANADVVELFERVHEGDPVVIVGTPADAAPTSSTGVASAAAAPAIPDPRRAHFHYAGLGGSGMSALAQFQVMLGGRASGSDRAFDRNERADERARLERLGIAIVPQDGGGVTGGVAALVVSTAVEDSVPDVAAARARGIPILHRSELLAHFVATFRTIAVTGTSGKSTVAAMIFELLRGAGLRPSIITGGELSSLRAEGLVGNAWYGGSDLLVVEADESDGSVVRYHPAVGIVLNLQKDHKEMAEVAAMFATFRRQIRETLVLGEDENLASLVNGPSPVFRFGFGPRADLRATGVTLGPETSRFEAEGIEFELPAPGRHNVENALASLAACRALGVPLANLVAPLARFQGVGRRFQTIGVARGVEVVDDFAHNPAKLTAALETAQRRAKRVLAVYQPHGYGPTRFLRADFVDTFATRLRPGDRVWLLEVFYAGGTAQRDFSARDLVAEIAARGTQAEFAPSRDWLIDRLAREAHEGDLVIVMGARDPSLTDLARAILQAVAAAGAVRNA